MSVIVGEFRILDDFRELSLCGPFCGKYQFTLKYSYTSKKNVCLIFLFIKDKKKFK